MNRLHLDDLAERIAPRVPMEPRKKLINRASRRARKTDGRAFAFGSLRA
jgi:hypothetical protein